MLQEMSYNNYLDADAAWNCVSEFSDPTCVVVKHTNPCGVASRGDILEAYRLAVKADPVSAFGGIVAFNVEIDEVYTYLIMRGSYKGKILISLYSRPTESNYNKQKDTSHFLSIEFQIKAHSWVN